MPPPPYTPPPAAPPPPPVVANPPAPAATSSTRATALVALAAVVAFIAYSEFRRPPAVAVTGAAPAGAARGAAVPPDRPRPDNHPAGGENPATGTPGAPEGTPPKTPPAGLAREDRDRLDALKAGLDTLAAEVKALRDRPDPKVPEPAPDDRDQVAFLRKEVEALTAALDDLARSRPVTTTTAPDGTPPTTVVTNEPPAPGTPPDGMTPEVRGTLDDLAGRFLNGDLVYGKDLLEAAERTLPPAAARAVREAVIHNTGPDGRMNRRAVADAVKKVKGPPAPERSR